jgi:hypothetical protein
VADQTVFRASRQVVRDIDEYARRLDRDFGVELTRAQAAQALVRLGLRQTNRDRKK